MKKTTFINRELIGLRIKILTHSDPTLIGRKGKVIDETMNTLVILDEDKNKKLIVPKLYGIFEFLLPSGKRISVDGTLIHGRPEDRLKRMQK